MRNDVQYEEVPSRECYTKKKKDENRRYEEKTKQTAKGIIRALLEIVENGSSAWKETDAKEKG